MALFNRLLTHVQNKKKEFIDTKDDLLWHKHSSSKHPPANVRVVLFRECERKGKKLLFDSFTVKKIDPRDQNLADNSYTEVSDGIAYQYLPSNSDAKIISEMIFGSASITYHSGNMKIHKLAEGTEVMWSSIFQAPTISKKPFKTNAAHSDTSLGSSFGCSLGSFPSTDHEDIFSLSMFPDILEDGSMRTDSGCYTSCTSFSQPGASFPSFPTMEFESMSSNLDLSDYGSVCSLQRRWLSTVQSSLLTRDFSSPILRETCHSPVKFGISPNTTSLQGSPRLSSSRFGSEFGRDNLRQGGRHAVLGLGIIIKPPENKLLEVLYSNNLILEDIYNKLLHTVQQAYIHKKRFVATMFNGFLECEKMVQDIFTVPILKLSAWHLLTQNQVDLGLQNKLLNDLCHLKKTFDTKETNFFISTLLTGVLTYHLGWVTTVMPASQPGQNLLNKHQVLGMDILSHWYNPVRMQFRELHGMLGCPVRAAKSLILANKEDLAKKLVFVLSYFIRCSQVFKQDLTWDKSDSEELRPEDLKTFIIKKDYSATTPSANEKRVPELFNVPSDESSHNSPSVLSKSNSSPNITTSCKPNFGKLSSNRIPTLSAALAALDLTPTSGRAKQTKENDKVLFLVGDDDTDKAVPEEQFDSGLDVEFSSDETEKSKPDKAFKSIFETESEEDESKSEHNDESNVKAKVVITKAVTVSMEPENSSNFVAVEVPLPTFSTKTTTPADLPSRICCSSSFVTGTILQSMYGDSSNWRDEVKEDLAAAKANSFIHAATEECVCLVGDVNKLEVSLVTAQNKLGLPVPMSPLVAGLLDEVVAAAEAGLPVSDVLRHLEDRLQVIYLHSCTLAEYLLTTELLDLQSLASSLDLDPCDVPLLLTVASTHTPLVGKKYGLSFIG